jgi:hypothetical protein
MSKVCTDNMRTIERLLLFIERAAELRKTSFAVKRQQIHFVLKELDTELNVVSPDENDLKAFLIDFRMFISDRDAVYLNRIFNVCNISIIDQQIRNKIIQLRKHWNKWHEGKIIIINGKEIKIEEIINLWIQGYYFHPNDLEKRKLIHKYAFKINPFAKLYFIEYLRMTSDTIFQTANLVREAIDNGNIAE